MHIVSIKIEILHAHIIFVDVEYSYDQTLRWKFSVFMYSFKVGIEGDIQKLLTIEYGWSFSSLALN